MTREYVVGTDFEAAQVAETRSNDATIAGAQLSETVDTNPTGSLSVTLESATASSSGYIVISSSLDATFDGASLSSGALIVIASSVSPTLSDLQSSSAGLSGGFGDVASTLDDVQSAFGGSLYLFGSLSHELDGFSLIAYGAILSAGSLSLSLTDLISSSDGKLVISAASIKQLHDLSLGASGGSYTSGSSNIAIDSVSSEISGKLRAKGAFISALEPAALSSFGDIYFASVGSQLGPLSLSSFLQLNIRARLTKQLNGSSLSANGSDKYRSGALSKSLLSVSISSRGRFRRRGVVRGKLDDLFLYPYRAPQIYEIDATGRFAFADALSGFETIQSLSGEIHSDAESARNYPVTVNGDAEALDAKSYLLVSIQSSQSSFDDEAQWTRREIDVSANRLELVT